MMNYLNGKLIGILTIYPCNFYPRNKKECVDVTMNMLIELKLKVLCS